MPSNISHMRPKLLYRPYVLCENNEEIYLFIPIETKIWESVFIYEILFTNVCN